MTRADPLLVDARRFAKAGGCFISEKNGQFRVYRKTTERAVYLGFRTNPGALRRFVMYLTAAD